MRSPGFEITCYDSHDGSVGWKHREQGLLVDHSKYAQAVAVRCVDNSVFLLSKASAGAFVAELDATDGGRRRAPRGGPLAHCPVDAGLLVRQDDSMAREARAVGGQHPLASAELELVDRVLAAFADSGDPAAAATSRVIEEQLESLSLFGQLLARYPSPLDEQRLGSMRRGLDTLVDSLVVTDQASFPFRAPTQALVGRTMNMAQINFLRLLWHVSRSLPDSEETMMLRELCANRLRASVHCRLVEEVLVEIVTDGVIERRLREQAVHSLAQLWANRLTWRVDTFFPILAETWEARQRVRVTGGTLVGCSEMFQLLTQGADSGFVELLACHQPGDHEEQAFREFLFGTSSEELERLAQRMAREDISSIEIDSRIGDASRDAGSILFEFFRSRLVQCSGRRIGNLAGPRHTAEGYVMLAWLAHR